MIIYDTTMEDSCHYIFDKSHRSTRAGVSPNVHYGLRVIVVDSALAKEQDVGLKARDG